MHRKFTYSDRTNIFIQQEAFGHPTKLGILPQNRKHIIQYEPLLINGCPARILPSLVLLSHYLHPCPRSRWQRSCHDLVLPGRLCKSAVPVTYNNMYPASPHSSALRVIYRTASGVLFCRCCRPLSQAATCWLREHCCASLSSMHHE